MQRERRQAYIGRPLPRFEDRRLVTGRGRFTDDFSFDGQAYAAFVRSPHAHARIEAIDTTRGRSCGGRARCLHGGGLRGGRRTGHHAHGQSRRHTRRERQGLHRPGAADSLRSAACAARGRARRASSASRLRWSWRKHTPRRRKPANASRRPTRSLPAVTDAAAALAPGAPLVDDAVPGNLAVGTEFGDCAAVEAAFAGAHLVVAQTFRNQRIAPAYMEPRAAIGSYDEAQGIYTPGDRQPGRRAHQRHRRRLPRRSGRARARHHPRCRRRVRPAQQHLSRAGPGGLCGAPCRPPGEMDG